MKNSRTGRLPRPSRRAIVSLVSALTIIGCVAWLLWDHHFRPIRKFRVIIPRMLYQSGQPDPVGLMRCVRKYNIRAILYTRAHLEQWEESMAKEMGVKLIHFPIDVEHVRSGELREVCRVFANSENYPMLVHCNAGRSRSSLLVAVHRIKFEHWPVHSAMQEMLAKGFPEDRLVAAQQNLEANLPSDDYEPRN